MMTSTKHAGPAPLTGRKVALIFCAGFGVIIAVNLTLAFKAVSTFPGLEVRNSYVASQGFDAQRAAQLALGWEVSAAYEAETLRLSILREGQPVRARIVSALLGRATNVAQDQRPDLMFDGQVYAAPVTLPAGNWNLRLVAETPDGTLFKQRVLLRVAR